MTGGRLAAGRPGAVLRALPAPRIRRPRARLLIALVVLAALAGAGFVWLRDSSLVAVREVTVTGLSSDDGPRIRAALAAAAREMTTLHVRPEQLEVAVAPFPVVAGVRVRADFPHRLLIEVREREPVAALSVDGARVPVAADGTILRGVRAPKDLALVPAPAVPAGPRLGPGGVGDVVRALAAAPAPLRARVERATRGRSGLEMELRAGPRILLGAPTRLEAKWLAAARVLADRAAAGATYVDVRVPERTAVGGLPIDAEEQGLAPGTGTAPAPDAAGAAAPDAAAPAAPSTATPPATAAPAGSPAPPATTQASPPAQTPPAPAGSPP